MKQIPGLLALLLPGLLWAGNGVSLSVLHTGNSFGNLESMVVAGGSWLRWRKPVMTAVLIRHPHGDVLLDTGFGRELDAHFADNSWLDRQLLRYENVSPAVDQLESAGVDPQSLHAIIPTHMHWDHVDALEDFIGVPVLVPPGAVAGARQGERAAYIAEQFDDPAINWRNLSFGDGPHLGYAASHDLFDDGSVVLVPLDGHTGYDVGAFVTLDSGRRYFFIGDISWTARGVEANRPRPWITNALLHVDADPEAVERALARIHALGSSDPDLAIVPAHDEEVAGRMARFPEFQR